MAHMGREEINLLCERFKVRLSDKPSINYKLDEFFPIRRAEEVFRDHEEDLLLLLKEVNGALLYGLLEEVVRRISQTLSNVLAIVLVGRPRDDTLILDQFLQLILREDNSLRDDPLLCDSELPISRTRANSLFPYHGGAFYSNQLLFSAIVLSKETETKYSTGEGVRCLVPYLEQEPIGRGGFGEVWKVKIEKHHLRTDKENESRIVVARKEFRTDREQEFQRELNILRQIMSKGKTHDHVVTVLAILQYESRYSLFFPLATYDLSHHFRESSTPGSQGEIEALYRRGVTLADALAFLHDGSLGVSCYHLDLKPPNVLVYDAGKKKELWKITDFGVSRVKIEDSSPRDGATKMTTGVEGTYLAPECAVLGASVSSLTDVWSFGCIFSLVLTFITKGHEGITEFSELRRLQQEGDFFYVNARQPQISPAVTEWFETLKAAVVGKPYSNIIRQALDYLLRDVLRPERTLRHPASEVKTRLLEILDGVPQSTSSTNPAVPERPHRRLSFFNRFRQSEGDHHRGVRRGSESAASLRSTKLPLYSESSMRGSKFSPDGGLLVSFSSSKNLIWDVSALDDALERRMDLPGPLSIPISGTVNLISVSSRYICNSVTASYFKCCIYSLDDRSPISLSFPDLGSIKIVSISRDGALAAFVITHEPGGNELDCVMYLCKTEDLVENAGRGWPPPLISSRSNSAISSSSVGSISDKSTSSRIGPSLGSAEDIRFFGFTSSGNFLVMVSQEGTDGFHIKAWRTDGTFYASMPIPHKGSVTLHAAHFTACTVYEVNGALGVVILSQEQYLLSADLWGRGWKKRRLKNEMVHVCSSIDNQLLIFLDTKRRLFFTLPTSEAHTSQPTQIANVSTIPKPIPSFLARNFEGGRINILAVGPEGKLLALDAPITN